MSSARPESKPNRRTIALATVMAASLALSSSASARTDMGLTKSGTKLTVKAPNNGSYYRIEVQTARPDANAYPDGQHPVAVGTLYPNGAFFVLLYIGVNVPGKGCVRADTADHSAPDVQSVYCDASRVRRIHVKTYKGNDVVNIEPTIRTPATILTGPGDDSVRGGAGDDIIKTGSGNDGIGLPDPIANQLYGVYGGGGSDLIDLGPGDGLQEAWGDENDALHQFYPPQPPGNDVIKGSGPSLKLHGMEGDDTLLGSWGADWLNGGPGADILRAGAGDDTVDATEIPEAPDLVVDCGTGDDIYFSDAGLDPVAMSCEN
jgi:hypothetical protein